MDQLVLFACVLEYDITMNIVSGQSIFTTDVVALVAIII